MNDNEPEVTWQFESYSTDEEIQFIELIKEVADTIEYRVSEPRKLKHIKQYAITYFNDISTDLENNDEN